MNKNSKSITVRNASPQEIAEFIREVNGKKAGNSKSFMMRGGLSGNGFLSTANESVIWRPARRKPDIFSICRAFTLFPVIYRRKLTGMHSLSGMRNG